MLLTGTMTCKDHDEFESIMGRLKGLPVEVFANEPDIIADYSPADTESDAEIDENVARFVDIIESVATHGFSLMAETR